jgi:hypothetical protein
MHPLVALFLSSDTRWSQFLAFNCFGHFVDSRTRVLQPVMSSVLYHIAAGSSATSNKLSIRAPVFVATKTPDGPATGESTLPGGRSTFTQQVIR